MSEAKVGIFTRDYSDTQHKFRPFEYFQIPIYHPHDEDSRASFGLHVACYV